MSTDQTPRPHPPDDLAYYDDAVAALLDAYRTGTPEAMERHYRYTWHRRAWAAMRSYAQLDVGKRPATPGGDVELTVDDARALVARDHGAASWDALTAAGQSSAGQPSPAQTTRPVGVAEVDGEHVRPLVVARDWDVVLGALRECAAEGRAVRLVANGQMTDDVLARVADIEGVTALHLAGSRALTDDGLRHLARLPHLTDLDLSGTAVTDAGAAHLASCRALRALNLMGTHTGDGALRALAGMTSLHTLHTGNGVTDDGIALLHALPVFAEWQGWQRGDEHVALTSYAPRPNRLVLRGTFTDRGVANLRGLDGLFALNLDDAALALTADAMIPLRALPRLGWLAADAKDDWMPHIAALPALRFLGAQDTTASDDGFVALSRSTSLEYLWGRRCHGLGRRGFEALSRMPALRGLSVSCLNVDDAGLAALPRFPALRELMPMDVPDAGYRHVGACAALESLVLMYCRDTTDAATQHITGLSCLTRYFNSYTTITDRTPALLATMPALEQVTFDQCHALTDAGVARLARLPRLRELRVAGRGMTEALRGAFPAGVSVHVGS